MLHIFISGSPVKKYEVVLSTNGIMEGKERQGESWQGLLVFSRK